MKITSVDIFSHNMGSQFANGAPWTQVVCRINTDEGISGFGEVGLAYGCGCNAGVGILKDFAPLLIGKDPFDSEKIWEMLFRQTFWGMGGGTVIFGGISAVDIALWDIKGKALGQPVYKLLGGKTNEKLRAYASQIQFGWGKESRPLNAPAEYAQAARQAVSEGYTCVKVDPIGFSDKAAWKATDWKTRGVLEYNVFKLAYDRVAAIRQEVGPQVDIIIELHAVTDTNSSIRLCTALEELDCFYYEEPVHPLNPESMRQVAQKVKTPIASGERIYGRWGFIPFLENRSLRVIQPDMGLCGGITEAKKICDMANAYDVAVQLHVCGGPIATAAALQVEAVLPNFLIHENHVAATREQIVSSCKYDYQPVQGFYTIPELPGIGQELSDKAMEQADKITIC